MNRKGCGRKWAWPNLGSYIGVCLQGLRKSPKDLSQYSLYVGQDLSFVSPEYEAGVLVTGLQCSFCPHCMLEAHNYTSIAYSWKSTIGLLAFICLQM